jgi:diguanylate cyclase (GGDEF)-like protein
MTLLLQRTIQATPAAKVLWAVATSLPALVLLLAVSHVAMGDAHLRGGLNVDVLIALQALVGGAVVVELAVAARMWTLRSRPQPVPLAVQTVCLTVGLAYTGMALACGLFTDSVNMPLLGLLAVGLLLFERQPMLITFAVCTTLNWAHDWGVQHHWWAYAPLWHEPVFDGRKPVWWMEVWRSAGFWVAYTVLLSLVMWLFSELDQMHARLRVLSHTDPLTNLFNRRRFMEGLDHELARQGRTAQPLSLVLIDADHFKRVNDEHGHDMGDDVLRALAKLLQDCVRSPTDLACRLGGEEFALILPDTDRDRATRVCSRVREQLAAMQFGEPGRRFRLTVSMGLVECQGEPMTHCLKEADAQLYRAKAGGRDRISAAPAAWGAAHG